jgi:hypothetical protein
MRIPELSIPRIFRGSREGDRVAQVGEAGDVGEGAFEAEAEAGVRRRAVAAQITPPQVVGLDVQLPQDRQERLAA